MVAPTSRIHRKGLGQYLKKLRRRLFGRRPRRRESYKARLRRQGEGFFGRYCRGRGLDVGYGGDLLCSNCRGWDFEHGDAQFLPGVAADSFDFLHSSHTLEHMPDPALALRNWWRVIRPGGYLILYLPHRDLYEKREELPSRWNPDHKWFFLPHRDAPPHTLGLVPLVENTLSGYTILECRVCDQGHTITDPEVHSDGEYSIEMVIRKDPLPD